MVEKEEDIKRYQDKKYYLKLSQEIIDKIKTTWGGGDLSTEELMSKLGSLSLSTECHDLLDQVDASIVYTKEVVDDLEECWHDLNKENTCGHQLNAIYDAVEELKDHYKDLVKCAIQTEFYLEKEKRKKEPY